MSDKEDKKYSIPESNSPLALYHINVNNYHPDWKLEEIALFEKMILNWKYYRQRQFRIGKGTLVSQLRLTRQRIDNAREFLTNRGYIRIITKSSRALNFYIVDEDKILDDIERIYDFSRFEKDKDQKEYQLKRTRSFMRMYMSTPSKGVRNIKKLSVELGVTEEKAEDIARGRFQIFGESNEGYSTDV